MTASNQSTNGAEYVKRTSSSKPSSFGSPNVRAATASGLPVLIEVDLAGARAVKKALPEALTVFLAPPSWEDLEARLLARDTETPEAIRRRLDTARGEMAAQEDFD